VTIIGDISINLSLFCPHPVNLFNLIFRWRYTEKKWTDSKICKIWLVHMVYYLLINR